VIVLRGIVSHVFHLYKFTNLKELIQGDFNRKVMEGIITKTSTMNFVTAKTHPKTMVYVSMEETANREF
jgi:hypothetical protein